MIEIKLIKDYKSAMSEIGYDIMCMRYGIENYNTPHTLEEIAKKYNTTRECIYKAIGKTEGIIYLLRAIEHN